MDQNKDRVKYFSPELQKSIKSSEKSVFRNIWRVLVGTKICKIASCRLLPMTFGRKMVNLDYFREKSCIVVYNRVN